VRLIGGMILSEATELCVISFLLLLMKATKPWKSDHPKGTGGNEINEGFLHPFVFFVIFC
jgi:hypothetical protein